MGKFKKLSAAITLGAIAALTSAAPSLAQNNQLSAAPELKHRLTPDEMTQILTILGFTVGLDSQTADMIILSATADDGVFYTGMRDCKDGACSLIEFFGFANGAGVTLGQVNQLNLERTVGATLGLMNDGSVLIARKVYMHGGLTVEHFGFNFGLFVTDLDMTAAAIKPGAKATVSFRKPVTSTAPFKFDTIKAVKNPIINSTGANAPEFMTPQVAEALKLGQ